MTYGPELIIRDIIIAIAMVVLIINRQKIRQLTNTLAEERRKRLCPYLLLEVDLQRIAIFLINESFCYAKNIRIEDMQIVVDVGFKKHLLLKFAHVDMLKPDEKIRLEYRVFDGQYDITTPDSSHLAFYFDDPQFTMKLAYTNIEDVLFTSTIGREKGKFIIREAKPVDIGQ